MTLDDEIRKSLTDRKTVLDKKLTSQASSILKQSILFVPSRKPYETVTNSLKLKYIHIKSQSSSSSSAEIELKSNGHAVQPSTSFVCERDILRATNVKPTGSRVPQAQFEIYPAANVRLTADDRFRAGANVGLNNLGNTCFLNSVLQILTHTVPLLNYLFSNHHEKSTCPKGTGFCGLCLLRNHVNHVYNKPRYGTVAVSPQQIVSNLRCIMKSHIHGRQEDAHEFLRYFVDALQNSALFQWKDRKLDLFTKETSPISRIFGGFHKSEIICNNCQSISTTFDPFLDLSLEIKQQGNVEQALTHFTRVETLSAENAYKCPKCHLKVSARKMFTIHQEPSVLTIQLKRFDHFGKIDRYVKFSDRLNIRPYMSEKQGVPVNYKLFGVVVHSGRTMNSGHYYAYVRNSLDQWHLMDDCRVTTVAPSTVLSSLAYILFYVRVPLQIAAVKPVVSPVIPSTPVIKPTTIVKLPLPTVIKTPPVQPVAPLQFVPRTVAVQQTIAAPPAAPVVAVLPQISNEKKPATHSDDVNSSSDASSSPSSSSLSNASEKKEVSRKRRQSSPSSSSSKHDKKKTKKELKKRRKKERRHHHQSKRSRSRSPDSRREHRRRHKDKERKLKKRKRSRAEHKSADSSTEEVPSKVVIREQIEKPIVRNVEKIVVTAPCYKTPSLTSPLEFLKMQCGSGYGSSVKSWSGETNAVDRKMNGSKEVSRVDDEWNDEYDRGKLKKFKSDRVVDRPKVAFKVNSFQRFQNRKNFNVI